MPSNPTAQESMSKPAKISAGDEYRRRIICMCLGINNTGEDHTSEDVER
jgi:hypothetical protein